MSRRVGCDLAASTGVHDGAGLIKQLLAGARAVQVVSTFYRNGRGACGGDARRAGTWMDRHGYKTIADFRGKMSQAESEDPAVYERVQFMKHYSGDWTAGTDDGWRRDIDLCHRRHGPRGARRRIRLCRCAARLLRPPHRLLLDEHRRAVQRLQDELHLPHRVPAGVLGPGDGGALPGGGERAPLLPQILAKKNLGMYAGRAEKLGVQLLEVRQAHLGTDGGVNLVRRS